MIASDAFLSEAAARLRASVVAIVDASRRRAGHGAGIAWGEGDLFVTSAHVVTRTKAVVVTSDGRAIEGNVIGRDARRDIAVVHAPASGVPPVATRDPSTLRPGSFVFAVGHPFGVKEAVSMGVFQAVGAAPEGYGLNGRSSLGWVQADIRLAPGNSGGPIADVEGKVIGVSAMIVSGLALGVPTPDVEQLLSSIR